MALRRTRLIHQFRGNRLQTAPGVEPISLAEVKTQLRLTGAGDDTFLTSLIAECRQEVEDATGLALINQSWRLTLDRWPHNKEDWWDGEREGHPDMIYGGNQSNYASIQLPRYPLVQVTAVSTFSEDGTETALSPITDTFDIDIQSLRGRMTLKNGATWPVALRSNNAIQIDYDAGYGTGATSVPAPLKRALRQMVAYTYEHRGDGCDAKDAFTASGAKSVLDRYRDIEL